MSFWHELGFRENPYSTTPIPPTAEGEQLLVGRESELRRLERVITSSASHPTIEGDNGVGKTSLVAVAGYRLMEQFVTEGSSQLFIPLPDPFQLTSAEDVEGFRRRVYFAAARAFIDHNGLIQKRSLGAPDVADVQKWLDEPLLSDRNVGITVVGSGGSAGQTTSVNDATGWSESGFQARVEAWLAECFPTPEAGAFICVIDNLELLETSQKARALLEALRDTVLNRRGLRWVLCGARGIVKSSASSTRLAGVLASPLELKPIKDKDIPLMIQRRIDEFAIDPNAYIPVNAGGFAYIYERLNRNLRDALNMAESYALQLDSLDLPEVPVNDLADWLVSEAVESLRATRLSPRPWKVFDDLVVRGGSCSPSDYEDFEFNSAEAFRAPVKNLEDANLVITTKADVDKRRKTISVTARGWLIATARNAPTRNSSEESEAEGDREAASAPTPQDD